MKRYALIVAGGSGSRMSTDIPKQFLEMAGKPILMYTLEAFIRFDPAIALILVLPSDQIDFWQSLCKKHHFSSKHALAEGGETRFQSVKNGLALVTDPGLIGVHDGVRPFVSQETLKMAYHMAEEKGNAIPVIETHESIRQEIENGSQPLDRTQIKLVQTPQVFQSSVLTEAYELPYQTIYTDDASVVETAGHTIYLSEGNRENIKITTPFDMIVANALLTVIS